LLPCTPSLHGYRWLLGLIHPYVGAVRASRLSARMVERAYRDLETAGYSRTTVRTLHLVLTKAFEEQVGRRLGAHKPRHSDDERRVWHRGTCSPAEPGSRCGRC
jgi:hypothetical protein